MTRPKTTENRPTRAARCEKRSIGIDCGMILPGSFFKPLPDELLRAFRGVGEE